MIYSPSNGWGDDMVGERTHQQQQQKIKWCSVLGAGCGAVVLLGVAYYLVSLGSLQRLAYVCVTLAGLTIMTCFVVLVFFVSSRQGSPTNRHHSSNTIDFKHYPQQDQPPPYRDSWRKAYNTRRVRDTNQLPPSSSSSTDPSFSSLLPSPSSLSKRISSLVLPTIFTLPPFVPHTSSSKSPPPSSSTRRNKPVDFRITIHQPYSTSQDDLPSYQVAVESMDDESIRRITEKVESGV